MKKILYISDLDGTLLRSDQSISKYSLDMINHFIQTGTVFSYATARSFSSASIVTKGLDLSIPAIVYNGVFLIDTKTGEKILKNSFTGRESQAISNVLKKSNIYPLVYSFVDGIERVSWLKGKETEGMKHYLSMRKGDPRLRETQDIHALYEGEVFYFTCIGEKEELRPSYQYFSEQGICRTIFQQELYRPEYWCEIMPRNASKANAILQLKKLLDCDFLVSFGDGKNDILMFEISDECYAMGNAVPELKAIATGIIGTNEEDSVANWLLKRGNR